MAVSCSVIFDLAAMLDVERSARFVDGLLLLLFDGVRLRGGFVVFAARPAKQMARRASRARPENALPC